MTLRPELDDLLVRIELDALAGVKSGRADAIGAPGVEYGVDLVAGGVPYRVRAGAPGAFTLLRCAAIYSPVGTLRGAIGSTGTEATIAVPLEAIGRPASLTGVRALSTLAGQRLDEATLGDVALDAPSVDLALAKPGAPPAGWVAAELNGGRFAGRVSTAGRFGGHDLWIRACSAGACAASATPVGLDRMPSTLALLVEGRGARRLLRVLLTAADGTPLAGRSVTLTADGDPLGSVITDAAGAATQPLPPTLVGGHHDFAAAFAGDDETAGSTASASS